MSASLARQGHAGKAGAPEQREGLGQAAQQGANLLATVFLDLANQGLYLLLQLAWAIKSGLGFQKAKQDLTLEQCSAVYQHDKQTNMHCELASRALWLLQCDILQSGNMQQLTTHTKTNPAAHESGARVASANMMSRMLRVCWCMCAFIRMKLPLPLSAAHSSYAAFICFCSSLT